MKVFTGIYLFLDASVTRDILCKLFLNNNNCIKHNRNGNIIQAYYKQPLDVAIILKESKSFDYRICFAADSDDKHSRKTLTIYKNAHMAFGIIEKSKGKILFQDKNTVVTKFSSFFITCKALEKLQKLKVKAKFTSYKEIQETRMISPL